MRTTDALLRLSVSVALFCAVCPSQSARGQSTLEKTREEVARTPVPSPLNEEADKPGPTEGASPQRPKELAIDEHLLQGPQAAFVSAAFASGEVLTAVGSGKVKRFSPDGTLLQVLETADSTPGFRNTTGMALDGINNLYVSLFTENDSPYSGALYKFDAFGTRVGFFGSSYNAHPESVVLDAVGNVFVGQADGLKRVLKFSPQGTLLDSFSPQTERRGLDWIDLAADQRTLFYTSEGTAVKRFDLQTKTQLGDFNRAPLPGGAAFALRVLPTGGVLVADSEKIIRLTPDGYIGQQYDAPGEDKWFAINLDPDGTSFWSGGYATGNVYRFSIATGTILTSWNAAPYTVLAGLAIVQERTAATSGPWVLPSSAFRAGANGAEFHTDVRLLNVSSSPVTVTATFYDQVTGATISAPEFPIGGRSQAAFDNVLQTLFGKTLSAGAFGPIRFDSTGAITVSSSVNNVNSCGTGATSGQWLPGIDTTKALTMGALPQLAVSASGATGYRTNLVLMNPGSGNATVTVRVWAGGGVLVSSGTVGPLPANGFRQVALDSAQAFPGVAGRTDTNLWVDFTSNQPVLVFASVINNASGDPFAVVATPVE